MEHRVTSYHESCPDADTYNDCLVDMQAQNITKCQRPRASIYVTAVTTLRATLWSAARHDANRSTVGRKYLSLASQLYTTVVKVTRRVKLITVSPAMTS